MNYSAILDEKKTVIGVEPRGCRVDSAGLTRSHTGAHLTQYGERGDQVVDVERETVIDIEKADGPVKLTTKGAIAKR